MDKPTQTLLVVFIAIAQRQREVRLFAPGFFGQKRDFDAFRKLETFGARFEMIERAGHFPHQEQPKVFAEKVMSFAGVK